MKDFKRSIVRLSSTGILLLERAFNYPSQQLGFDLEAYASGSCTCNISILDQEDESTGTVTPPEEILPPVKAPELDCSAFLHAVPWNRIASEHLLAFCSYIQSGPHSSSVLVLALSAVVSCCFFSFADIVFVVAVAVVAVIVVVILVTNS